MHPDDAAARGLAESDLVRIFNELGEVHCPLTVAPSIRPGTVSLPKGHLAAQHAQRRRPARRWCPTRSTDLGGGACFNDARVQVASLPNA